MFATKFALATEDESKQSVKVCQSESSQFVKFLSMTTFGERLRIAFNNAKNAEIARKLEVSEAAVKNYVQGRVPDAEKLVKIKNLTNCSLDWLLTGQPEKEIKAEPTPLTVDALLEQKIRSVVREELWRGSYSKTTPGTLADEIEQDLGTIDEFDIASAIEK